MDFHQSAYDLKFFNFTAQQISAEREHLMQCIISKAIGSAITKIEIPATSALLKAKKETVVNRFQEACKNMFISLRDLDQKVFHIPTNVLQAQDFPLEAQYSSDDEEIRKTKLEELKSRFRENMAMLAQLRMEEKKYAEMEDVIQQEIEMQNQVYEACSSLNLSKFTQLCTRITSEQKSPMQA